jgi:hypothetical protein
MSKTELKEHLAISYDCNTISGINAYLGGDIDGLHWLLEARMARVKKYSERMGYVSMNQLDEFILFGNFLLTTDGYLREIGRLHQAYKDITWQNSLQKVVKVSDLERVFPGVGYELYWFHYLPTSEDKCDECGKGFSIKNINDIHFSCQTRLTEENQVKITRHKACQTLIEQRKEYEYFRKLLDEAGYQKALMTEIPNKYWSKDAGHPWFNVRLPGGVIEIGWRKRVISIDWSAHSKIDMTEEFKNEDVTKDSTSIHAWGHQKALDYLKLLKEKIDHA